MIPDLITRLDRWLMSNRPTYHQQLLPGVSSDELNRVEDRFGVQLPIAFRLLYKWRNGQSLNRSQSLEMNWQWMTLDSIVDTKIMLDSMIASDFESPDWWRREWLPFLQNRDGDLTVIDFLGFDGGRPRQILTFWHDESIRPVLYDSLDQWLTELIESMETDTLEVF